MLRNIYRHPIWSLIESDRAWPHGTATAAEPQPYLDANRSHTTKPSRLPILSSPISHNPPILTTARALVTQGQATAKDNSSPAPKYLERHNHSRSDGEQGYTAYTKRGSALIWSHIAQNPSLPAGSIILHPRERLHVKRCTAQSFTHLLFSASTPGSYSPRRISRACPLFPIGKELLACSHCAPCIPQLTNKEPIQTAHTDTRTPTNTSPYLASMATCLSPLLLRSPLQHLQQGLCPPTGL